MKWSKLNPANSLFGRIFLWFWLAALLLIFVGAWLAKLTSADFNVKPISNNALSQLNSLAKRIESVDRRRPSADLPSLLQRAGQRNKLALILVRKDTLDFVYGFPRRLSPLKAPLLALIDQEEIFSIHSASGVFYGPKRVNIKRQTYYLFAGKPLKKITFAQRVRNNPVLYALTLFTVSGGFCALLAWSLTRPIRALSFSAREVAKGDLRQRVEFATHRNDELGDLGKDFNIMTDRLAHLLEAQKRLLADVSHELRSPLARLNMSIGILQTSDDAMHQTTQLHLSRIEKEAAQIDSMIEQVLMLSRLEASQNTENRQIIDIETLLLPMLDDAKFEADNAGKVIRIDGLTSTEIDCYPTLFCRAISNVLRNAIKYCSTKVEVTFKNESSRIQVIVIDDGEGVPKQHIDELFTPFYRISSSRVRDSGGTGLGLAIVKHAIELHKGKVHAENTMMGGLCVTITVPVQQ